MISAKQAATYIFNRYRSIHNSDIDEMKLHKLLYFSQREALILIGEAMFPESFEAWKYGPVMVAIRDIYRRKDFNDLMCDDDLRLYSPVFDSVFENYAEQDSWSLSLLSHGEISWKNARKDATDEDNCHSIIKVEDIAKDAERIKFRRFLFNEIIPANQQ